MEPWATYDDVAIRWVAIGAGSYPVSVASTEVLIADATELIIKTIPDVPARLTAGTLSAGLVKQVISRMIIGYLQNGGGLASITSTKGPYTESRAYTKPNRVELELSDSDIDLLIEVSQNKVYGYNSIPFAHTFYTPYGSIVEYFDL